jgi:hypothetical protein
VPDACESLCCLGSHLGRGISECSNQSRHSLVGALAPLKGVAEPQRRIGSKLGRRITERQQQFVEGPRAIKRLGGINAAKRETGRGEKPDEDVRIPETLFECGLETGLSDSPECHDGASPHHHLGVANRCDEAGDCARVANSAEHFRC